MGSTLPGKGVGSWPLLNLKSVLGRPGQCGEFAPGFLSRDEVGVGILPDIEQLLITADGGGFVEMGLGAGCA
jgi:hypothetical protein